MLVNFYKIKVGSSGNINESPTTMVGFIGLSILCLVFLAVFFLLQTYVLRAEWWGSLFMLVISLLEFIGGIFAACSFTGID